MTDPRQKPAKPERIGKREIFLSVLGALLLWAAVRSFLVQVYGITTGSMAGTLLPGDYVVTSNTAFGPSIPFTRLHLPALREPRHGEVVVYRPAGYEPVVDVIKRVIGVPGDTVEMRGRVVYRNGRRLAEPYADSSYTPDRPMAEAGPQNAAWHRLALPAGLSAEGYHPTRDSWGPLVVPEDHYLMLGDDRDESVDSRYTGFVPRSEIRGKVYLIYYSGEVGARGARPRPRWERIGDRVH
jgi:signal peptidase I